MGQGLMSLLGGANSMLADSSHNLSIKENSECYVKMVPDSFEGYGNLDEENGKSIHLSRSKDYISDNKMEAEAVWDVSKLLEISFKGRREAVIKRKKSSFLAELLAFFKPWQIPWCIGGDFNMFLDLEEKLGQSLNTSLIDIFKAFVFKAGLTDIPLQWDVAGKSILNDNAILLSESSFNWGPKPSRIGGLIKGSKLVLKKWFGNSFRGTIKPIANLEKEISEVERRLQGGNYAPDLPSMDEHIDVFHLQFVDDLLIFYGDSKGQIQNVRRALRFSSLLRASN
ncbi:hypothetical protein V6N11_031372 [Hibiscus sabdariffa]|uniref:Reverse transcriptase n=1 Tax=Hibiscus sabdariffa TaxID=183260 RepID=A0ABR2SY40_9ROSI